MNRPIHPEQVNIRAATDQDAEAIARIYNHYVDCGGATFDAEHWSVDYAVACLGQEKPDGWFVAEHEHVVLGWASARRYGTRFGYRFTCETAIYLDPCAIGVGTANALQHRLHQHCTECNLHHAVARIIADNRRSIAFHQRHGYQLVGIQKEIGRIDDQWVDVAILQKIF